MAIESKTTNKNISNTRLLEVPIYGYYKWFLSTWILQVPLIPLKDTHLPILHDITQNKSNTNIRLQTTEILMTQIL